VFKEGYVPPISQGTQAGDRGRCGSAGNELRKYVGADILACEGQGTDGKEEESNAHN
jgi:hypothetical protein